MRPWSVVEAEVVHFKHTWRSTIATTVLFPLVLLVSLGIGIGRLVQHSDALPLASYPQFLAPAIVAGAGMQVGVTEATMPVFVSLNLTRTAVAAAATPVGTVGLVQGRLIWTVLRAGLSIATVVAVAVALGALRLSAGPAMLAVGVLVAAAHAAPSLAYTATQTVPYRLNALIRLAVLPMLLGAGTIAPIDILPTTLAHLARATPLWNGVDLCRAIAYGHVTSARAVVQIGYLLACVAVGYVAALRTVARRLGQ
jgi:lipooligosaccharide transport system permease protein